MVDVVKRERVFAMLEVEVEVKESQSVVDSGW